MTFRAVLSLVVVFIVCAALGWFACLGLKPAPSKLGGSVSLATDRKIATVSTSGNERAFEETAQAKDGTNYEHRLRLARAAETLDQDEAVAALERARQFHGDYHGRGDMATEALLARFAELDPAAATIWLLQNYRIPETGESWPDITLSAWLAKDRAGALAWARGLPATQRRSMALATIIKRLSEVDPEAAEQQISLLRVGEDNLSDIYRSLAEKDLAGTVDRASKLPARSAKAALEGIVRSWAPRDPAGAAAWLKGLPRGEARDTAASRLYSIWESADPAATAAYLLAEGNPDLARYASRLGETWWHTDRAAAERWTEQLPPGMSRDNALQEFTLQRGEEDPRGEVLRIVGSPKVRQRDAGLVPQFVAAWAKQDFAAARAWMEALPPGDNRQYALSGLAQEWVEKDPRAVVDYLRGQPDQEAMESTMRETVRQWSLSSPDEVWRWSRDLADEELRGDAAAFALGRITMDDPVRASGMLKELSDERQAPLGHDIAEGWTKTDLPAVQKWVPTLPEGEVRDAARQGMLQSWSGYDWEGAAAWMEKQPPDAGRDSGIEFLVANDANDDQPVKPAEAVRLARAMTDAEKRNNVLQRVAAAWLKKDRPGATAWIQSAPELSAEVRTELLAPPKEEDANE